MSRDYRLYLDDIIEAVRRIREFTDGMDFDDFKEDIKIQMSIIQRENVR